MTKEPKKAVKDAKAAGAQRYVEGVGRRKTAVARVRLFDGKGEFLVNGKKVTDYFSFDRLRTAAQAPLTLLKLADKFRVSAKVAGGGVKAQAEAVRHGLSRALVLSDETAKKRLRSAGYLTRDPRMVERKKYGLKKARRAPQWQKR